MPFESKRAKLVLSEKTREQLQALSVSYTGDREFKDPMAAQAKWECGQMG